MAGCPRSSLQEKIKNSQMCPLKQNYRTGALWKMNKVNVTCAELSKMNFIIIQKVRLE